MRNMVIVILLVFCISANASTDPLQLLTIEYPPYCYQEDGEVKGIAVDIIQEAFKRIDQPITLKILPWKRALKYIKSGKADGLFPVLKKTERELFADYSKAMMLESVSLFVKNDSNITFDGKLSSMGKYKFGAIQGFSYGEKFDKAVKDSYIKEIKVVTTGTQALKMLVKGRTDVLVSDRYYALYNSKKLGTENKIKELLPRIEDTPSYLILSKKRNLSSIRDQFDVSLAEMKKDGSYDRIIEKFFKMLE